MRSLLRHGLVCFGLVLLACSSAPSGTSGSACSPGGGCPGGQSCAWDNHCYPPGGAPANPNRPDLSAGVPDLGMQCTDATCAAPTPLCDAVSGLCVQCFLDTQCPEGAICKNKSCVRGCSMTRSCGDGGACDVAAGTCHGCSNDVDCGDPAKPRCESGSGQCVPCLPPIGNVPDNCGNGLYCQKVNGAYQCAMGCKIDTDCKAMTPDGGTPPRLVCCANYCIDLATDAANCGQCGQACAHGLACCSSVCVDTGKDAGNCGACGRSCSGGHASWQCSNAACTVQSCSDPFHDCDNNPANGCEVNVNTDPNNCTACGSVCVTPNGVPACNGGCLVGSCMPGFADCDKASMNGCEINLGTDLNNCGQCGNPCQMAPNSTPGCVMGMCAVATCTKGFGDCDKLPGDGCETALSNDVNNCGVCGAQCPMVAHASTNCLAGACLLQCIGNFKDCNGNLGDGCEANVATDPVNCNACGRICATPANAMAGCANGACGIGACNMGFKDCNNSANDGCEINTATDGNNCGACGNVCPVVMHGMGGCVAGKCAVGQCDAGYADCNGNAADGCEVNLKADKMNCGKCGTICPQNQPSCSSGMCSTLPPVFVTWGGKNWYKVQVVGAMTDTNVWNTCQNAGLTCGCQIAGNCSYNDNLCNMNTPENSCGNPMIRLAQGICNGSSPNACPALNGVYQYMGHHWGNDDSCGTLGGQWCSAGSGVQNMFALCMER